MVPLDKLTYNGKTKEQFEKEAVAQINQATLLGITNGENASKKLHADAKVQSEEKTAEAIGRLKDKFDSTKTQVLQIVNNFGKIRADLQELKNEYIQEQSLIQYNYVQLDENAMTQADLRVNSLQERVAIKQKEMQTAYSNFQNLIGELKGIKTQIDDAKNEEQYELLNLQNEQDDIKLVQLFEQQSEKMRQVLKSNEHRSTQQESLKHKISRNLRQKSPELAK